MKPILIFYLILSVKHRGRGFSLKIAPTGLRVQFPRSKRCVVFDARGAFSTPFKIISFYKKKKLFPIIPTFN